MRQTMKALYRRRYGGPDLLEIRELERPVPGKGEIRVKTMVTTVNRTDAGVLTGEPFIFRFFTGFPRPRTTAPGTDFAGIVDAVGDGVPDYQKGDRVFGFCDNGIGSQAEYFILKSTAPFRKIPEGVSFENAAAALEGSHYALNFLRLLPLEFGQRVFVNGATGAIGSAMVQLLHAKGVYVTASAPGGYEDEIKKRGADRVIDYQKINFWEEEQRYDHVLDAVGKSAFSLAKRVLIKGGCYVSSELGSGNENLYLPIVTRFSSERVLFPFPKDIPSSILTMQEMLSKRHFSPLIDREYSMEEAAEAYRYAMSGEKIGNVLLRFNGV